ncbi:hypothetical protein AQUSIP_02700 [Aquicella siphonis]|uniref:Uncharacterized protein n=1 Tax=Aquicella siphonis TaxID=254247 RepID=A0A5E4PF86_9COXI|nr:hypothetical protein AQUSIP_02700 [Aquicella siphonis]
MVCPKDLISGSSRHDEMEAKLDDLNKAIDTGLTQLRKGQKISAQESYERLKNKITKIENENL